MTKPTKMILDVLRTSAETPCPVAGSWPYLAKLIPEEGISGEAVVEAARVDDASSTVVTVYAAACDGLRRLAAPGGWSIAKVGVTAGALRQRLIWMARDGYAKGYRTANGLIVAEHGFEEWLAQPLDHTAPTMSGSCVTPVGRGLQVRLPGSLSVRDFDRALSEALDVVAVDRVMATPAGMARCAAFGLDVERYRRVTSYDFAGRPRISRAREILFFRPRLDTMALIRIIEAVVARHLASIIGEVPRAA